MRPPRLRIGRLWKLQTQNLLVNVDSFDWENFEDYEDCCCIYAKYGYTFFCEIDEASSCADVIAVFEFAQVDV